jgi:hypothetical protein
MYGKALIEISLWWDPQLASAASHRGAEGRRAQLCGFLGDIARRLKEAASPRRRAENLPDVSTLTACWPIG